MKHHMVLATLAIAAASCSSSNPTPPAPPPPPPYVAPAQPLSVSSETIKAVQNKLQEFGYYRGGHVDGVFGRDTERALTDFQGKNALAATGQIDGPTLQALKLTPNGTDATPVNSGNP